MEAEFVQVVGVVLIGYTKYGVYDDFNEYGDYIYCAYKHINWIQACLALNNGTNSNKDDNKIINI